MDVIDKDKAASFILSLYQPDGSFITDKYGELDLRFNYCAVQSMALLGKLEELDREQIAKYICSCQNIDGGLIMFFSSIAGFGSIPGAESHSGMVFCAIGALSILHEIHRCNVDRLCASFYALLTLGHWLDYRQVDSGGLNGRPEKQCDLCYSWWSLSAMIVLSIKSIVSE